MTEFEKLVLEKLDDVKSEMNDMKSDINDMKSDINDMKSEMNDMKSDINDMKSEMNEMKSDISALKRTAVKTEIELMPKVQIMLDSYMSLAEKVNISNDIQEEVKTLRYEVDLIKGVLQMN